MYEDDYRTYLRDSLGEVQLTFMPGDEVFVQLYLDFGEDWRDAEEDIWEYSGSA